MTPVRIIIRTTYRAGAASEHAVNTYDGMRYEKDGEVVLRYEERLSEDAAPVMTTMRLGQNQARLHRKGSVGGDMIFKEDLPCEFFYRTGFGNLPMGIVTHGYSLEDGKVLRVKISYTLYASGDAVSETEMEIEAS